MLRRLLVLPLTAVLWAVFGPTHAGAVGVLAVADVRLADGRAVEVVGEVSTAATVVVLVPGVDTTAANFDRGLGGVQRRAPAWQARQLAARACPPADPPTDQPGALPAGCRVAVVAWLGYHPPRGIRLAAVREDAAAAGADALLRFLRGIPAPRIVLVGHSYGSTVIGLAAARLDGRVTDLVALGSPGMGADRAADLHTTARVWAGTAADDWTRRLPGGRILGAGHGTHPTAASFGALRLPVGGVAGHDGYYLPGTATLDALTAIALGDIDAAARHHA